MKKFLIFSGLYLSALFVFSHETINGYKSGPDRAISFPDTEDYLTISSDLHTHSVFSDGHVWPNIRVAEALKDNLDSIAITEHLEYQPHTKYIPNVDRNDAYKEALEAAADSDLIVISGSEITREMPPGHLNAVFINDANDLFNLDRTKLPEAQQLIKQALGDAELDEDDRVVGEIYALGNLWSPVEALTAAKKQGAFVFWNHPMWSSQARDGIAKLSDMHKLFIQNDLMQGIEIVNTRTYSEEAFRIALDNNLTLIGTSDVHNLIEWDYDSTQEEHRPVTLVLAKERTKESIREALFDRRTVVFFKHRLIGKAENLNPLLKSIINITSNGYQSNSEILRIDIQNNSSSNMVLQNLSEVNFANSDDLIHLPKNGKVSLSVKTLGKKESQLFKFKVLNALVEPKVHPEIEFLLDI